MGSDESLTEKTARRIVTGVFIALAIVTAVLCWSAIELVQWITSK